jgi:dipeptidase
MSPLLRICPLALFLASVCASGGIAQPSADRASAIVPGVQLPYTAPARATPSATASEEEIRQKTAYWHTECIGDWDRQTHMSKKEWADTCQRIVADRVKWLRSQDHLESLYGP